MTSIKTSHFILLLLLWITSCRTQPKVREEDKIFHAAPAGIHDGWDGGIFFGLYKGNKYEFCDGNFMNPGCYTGFYCLSGDTIILEDLKKHDGIPTNKFIIRRYCDMDSSYWQWKYPDHKSDWRNMRQNDSTISSTGDIFPLDENDKIVFDRDNYFIIRFDSLKNNR